MEKAESQIYNDYQRRNGLALESIKYIINLVINNGEGGYHD